MRVRAISSVFSVLALATSSQAQTESIDRLTGEIAELAGTQQQQTLPLRVIDENGRPVAGARVTPWALRSSQGHGWWPVDDKRAGLGPKTVETDPQGLAVVRYPYFRDVEEQTRTISVSLRVDHPQFAILGDLHIDVPLEAKGPRDVQLTTGVPVDVRPLLDGKPVALDTLHAVWSDDRSWLPGVAPQKLEDGTLRIPAMPPGENSLLLVRLEGERATHFSDVIDFPLVAGEPKMLDVTLRPGKAVSGALSDNVPRPVREGRIKAWTLHPQRSGFNRVNWFTWVPIQPDGTFSIENWPAGEGVQLIALCEGYIATSGAAPVAVENPPDPATDSFNRPQVFEPDQFDDVTVEMTPLSRCIATVVDEAAEPVAGATIQSWPNVGWWNDGSQLYCHPLVRGERRLLLRDYQAAVEDVHVQPFQAETDAEGKATLWLPVGKEGLNVHSEIYELPSFLGRRSVNVDMSEDKPTEVTLRLQPRGTDSLGEWDKLAGVVFGCSTREGRRICALPGVRQQMDEITQKFRQAANPRDPALLFEAYSAIAAAFDDVGDQVEAAKWRTKAAEQQGKITEPR